MEEARRQGKGLRVCDWHLSLQPINDHQDLDHQDLMEALLDWCKDTMAATRRPYGVDHFDLVLALRSGDVVRNHSFSQLRILQLYDESFSRQVLGTLAKELRETGSQVVHVAAGLFSWGDALHAALGTQERPAAV